MIKDELCVNGNVILRGTRILIPEALQKQVLAIAHEGHPVITNIKNRLRSKVWWGKMDKYIENYMKTCESCQMVQKTVLITLLVRNELPSKPDRKSVV